MPKIRYQEIAFKPKSLLMIQQAEAIITEYQRQGFILTLRQLYYQFVARDLLTNTIRSYKQLGSVINDARLAGLIDWNSIEDRTRNLQENPHWEGPESIVQACARQFRYDLWANQKVRPEVWIEKEALVGVIAGVCRELDVPFFACRGYVSQSEQWRAGRRYRDVRRASQVPLVLHFGDHDPSGIDMTRDNGERLALFAEHGVEVRRLALNMDQVQQYGCPPNPAKTTDSRFEGYMAIHGDESWELDALEPSVIVDLIRTEVLSVRDETLWGEAVARQEEARAQLERVADRWDEIVDTLE